MALTINRGKLAALQERHASLLAEHLRLGQVAVERALAAARLRNEGRALFAEPPAAPLPKGTFAFVSHKDAVRDASHDAGARIFDLSVSELEALDLSSDAIASDVVAKIIDAEAAASRARAHADEYARQARDARALLDRLEAYAAQQKR